MTLALFDGAQRGHVERGASPELGVTFVKVRACER
jgi:hypothetical protein